MDYVTIDFEASCLPRHGRSFPIEVGIAGPTGARAWLIKPHASWHDWDWTEEAFALHGIPRDRLHDEGLAPEIVLDQLQGAIGGARVIADSSIDAIWLQTLATAAERRPAFGIEHIAALLDELGATTEQILLSQRRADALCPARHRADTDARWLWTLISSLRHAISASQDGVPPPWQNDVPWISATRSYQGAVAA